MVLRRNLPMFRAGRERAEDIKRRLVAACEEVGLTVTQARMILFKDQGVRIVHVGAAAPGWRHETPMLTVMAIAKVTGDWPESVDIRCGATDGDPTMVAGPWMKGRDRIPFSGLIDQLMETLEERAEVVRRLESGMRGPFRFERSVWANVNLLEGWKPCE